MLLLITEFQRAREKELLPEELEVALALLLLLAFYKFKLTHTAGLYERTYMLWNILLIRGCWRCGYGLRPEEEEGRNFSLLPQ